MSTAPEFNVGIGTSHIINSNVYSSVRVFCDVAVNDNQTVAAVRFLINGVEASISNQTGVSTAGTPNSLVLTQTSLSSGTTIYTCEATVGNTTFTKNSVINVMGKYSVITKTFCCVYDNLILYHYSVLAS